MKSLIRSLWILSLAVFVVAPSTPAQQGQQVSGVGCVESSVDAQCLVLRDLSTGALYNLRLDQSGPAAGEAIEFTAVPRPGANLCLQGQAMLVTRWVRNQVLRCATTGARGVQASLQPAPGAMPGYTLR